MLCVIACRSLSFLAFWLGYIVLIELLHLVTALDNPPAMELLPLPYFEVVGAGLAKECLYLLGKSIVSIASRGL